jgi:hypothetical protein
MNEAKNKSISISLDRSEWNAISNTLDIFARSNNSNEWFQWTKQINQFIQINLQKSSSNLVSITLSELNWNAIKNAIQTTCRNSSPEWQQWADCMAEKIHQEVQSLSTPPSISTLAPSTTSTSTSDSKSSDLFEKYYQKVRDEWDFPDGIDPELHREKLTKIASYLQLAIDNAKGPIPNALGRMSLVMLFLNELKKAEYFSNMAIGQEKHNIFAWVTKFALAEDKLLGHRPGYVDFSSGGGAVFSVFSLGASAISKSNKVSNLRMTAQNLAWAFTETVKVEAEDNVEDWLNSGEMLLNLAEDLKRYRIIEPALYKAVAHAQWEKVRSSEFKEQVDDLQARAKALYQLSGGR